VLEMQKTCTRCQLLLESNMVVVCVVHSMHSGVGICNEQCKAAAAYVFFYALVLPGAANQRVPVGRHKGVCTLMVQGVLWPFVLLLQGHVLSCWQR
jgi:hypothetical protein